MWHPLDMRVFAPSALALALCSLAPHCLACACMTVTPADQVVHFGPSFRVRVDDNRGRPVRGLSLEVQSSAGKSKAVTDENGFVSFRDLSPGIYSLRAEQDLGSCLGKVLEVESDAPGGITVPVTWPTIAPVQVRSLKGILHIPNYVPGRAGPELPLRLLVGVSGQEVASVHTNGTGNFDFGAAAPGIYFLNLEPSALKDSTGNPISGRIAVSVEPDAESDHLDVELGWTDCGLTYMDLNRCPPTELHIGQLRGRVIGPAGAVIVNGGDALRHKFVHIDPAGPAVPNAEILLVDPGGDLIERLSTDRLGEFALKQVPAGSYDLLVRAFGFATFRARAFVSPDTSPIGRLDIQLGNMRSCGSVRVQ
jgi:hypothetical protein